MEAWEKEVYTELRDCDWRRCLDHLFLLQMSQMGQRARKCAIADDSHYVLGHFKHWSIRQEGPIVVSEVPGVDAVAHWTAGPAGTVDGVEHVLRN